jgi:uncharacterized protein (DUF1778 family)
MVKSLRLDSGLADQLREAARLQGLSESDFIRGAIAARVQRVLASADLSIFDQVEDLLDLEGTGEQVTPDTHAAFERVLLERHGHPG